MFWPYQNNEQELEEIINKRLEIVDNFDNYEKEFVPIMDPP